MKNKLKIGIRLVQTGTLDIKSGNVTGDELIARGWQKSLLKTDFVESVNLYNMNDIIDEQPDVVIHFHPNQPLHPQAKNLFYLQNAYQKPQNLGKTRGAGLMYEGGTVEAFHKFINNKYDGYLFTSQKLKDHCADGAVIPFATDADFFYTQTSGLYEYPLSFVGNGIRSASVNQRYFAPLINLGLVIHGNMWTIPPLNSVCRGLLPMPDLPKLYSESLINLNAHISEHLEWETINLRIYDILACGGFIISDYFESLENTFGDTIVYSDGYEDIWAKAVEYLANSEERKRRSEEGKKIVLAHHTYDQRMKVLLDFLQEIL
ncbi:MAG: glycosyltransferase [Sphaerospermopsis kisseleviana]